MNWRPVAIVAAWAAGALVTLRFDPAAIQLYLIISIFALILTNLGTRRTGPSAYSVFNKNCATLPGQLRAEQFDDEVRHRPVNDTTTRETHRPTTTGRRLGGSGHGRGGPIHSAAGHDALLGDLRAEIAQERHRQQRGSASASSGGAFGRRLMRVRKDTTS